MTNTKPLPTTGPRHALRRLTIRPAFRPTGGTLLVIALIFLAGDMALGGGPAMAAAIWNFVIVPCVAFNDFIFMILDAVGHFFAQLPNELNPVS
jgi:hypothetical protein